MVQADPLDDFDADLAAFHNRLAELRDSGGSDAERLVLLELESAADRLRQVSGALTTRADEMAKRQIAAERERAMLRAVFRDLPLAVLLLDRDGRVRRANTRAHSLLGVSADYVSGQPLVMFLDAADRNLFRMRLSVLHRSGAEQSLPVTLARRGQPVAARLTLTHVDQPGDPRPLVAVIAVPTAGPPRGVGSGALEFTRAEALLATDPPDPARPPTAQTEPASDEIRAQARSGDVIREVTRILLEETDSTDALVLQRVGTRLAAGLADWVVVDVVRDAGAKTRAVVAAPAAERESTLTKSLERADVSAATLPAQVMATGAAVLRPHLADLSVLGADQRGVSFLSALGAHSLLCVPLSRAGQVIGTVSLVRTSNNEPFRLTDQAAAEEIGDLLGRSLLREPRSTVAPGAGDPAEPFLPQRVLAAPQVDVAWLHVPGRGGAAPFLDIYDLPGGWGATLGSVPVGGSTARAYVAMVRQWALLLGSDNVVPSGVLDELDDGLRRLRPGDLAVSAAILTLERRDAQLAVAMASAGHRSSLCVRADGRVQRTDGGGVALNSPGGYDTHADTDVLERGDTLVLYSNELADVSNAAGETFGGSGELANCLARVAGQTARRVVDTLAAVLAEFAPGGPTDAMVALVIRFIGDTD